MGSWLDSGSDGEIKFEVRCSRIQRSPLTNIPGLAPTEAPPGEPKVSALLAEGAPRSARACLGEGVALEGGGVRVEDRSDAAGGVAVLSSASGALLATLASHTFGETWQDGETSALAEFALHGLPRAYGLGEHRTGRISYAAGFKHHFEDSTVYAKSYGADVSIPWLALLPSEGAVGEGLGFLWNRAAMGYVELRGDADADTLNAMAWMANATSELDFWVVSGTGASPAAAQGTPGPLPALARAYARATGMPRQPPAFASGFWQSKLRYREQAEVEGIAETYNTSGLLPLLSVLVIDYYHWRTVRLAVLRIGEPSSSDQSLSRLLPYSLVTGPSTLPAGPTPLRWPRRSQQAVYTSWRAFGRLWTQRRSITSTWPRKRCLSGMSPGSPL